MLACMAVPTCPNQRFPAVKKSDKEQPLIDDIRLLGRMLGDVIREQEGSAAFELIEPRSDSFWRHSYRIKVPVDGRTALITDRYRAQYAPGYAPVELGGFKAHTFRIEMIIWPDPKSSYKVEDLAQLLGKTKPDSLVYLLSAKGDPREREGLEPIGVF